VGGTDIPRITLCHFVGLYLPSLHPHTSGNRQVSNERRVDYRVGVAHDGVHKQGYDNGRATPDGVLAVAAFAMVLFSVS